MIKLPAPDFKEALRVLRAFTDRPDCIGATLSVQGAQVVLCASVGAARITIRLNPLTMGKGAAQLSGDLHHVQVVRGSQAPTDARALARIADCGTVWVGGVSLPMFPVGTLRTGVHLPVSEAPLRELIAATMWATVTTDSDRVELHWQRDQWAALIDPVVVEC